MDINAHEIDKNITKYATALLNDKQVLEMEDCEKAVHQFILNLVIQEQDFHTPIGLYSLIQGIINKIEELLPEVDKAKKDLYENFDIKKVEIYAQKMTKLYEYHLYAKTVKRLIKKLNYFEFTFNDDK